MQAKQALGPLSDGSKDHGTQMPPFSRLELYTFSDEGKYYAFKL